MLKKAGPTGYFGLRDTALEVDWKLEGGNVQSLIFICRDFLRGSREGDANSCVDILDVLRTSKQLSDKSIRNIFGEALCLISRPDLAEWFGFYSHDFRTFDDDEGSHFSGFRLLLLRIVNILSEEDCDIINRIAPQSSRGINSDIHRLFVEFEDCGLIGETDISFLYRIDEELHNKLRPLLIKYDNERRNREEMNPLDPPFREGNNHTVEMPNSLSNNQTPVGPITSAVRATGPEDKGNTLTYQIPETVVTLGSHQQGHCHILSENNTECSDCLKSFGQMRCQKDGAACSTAEEWTVPPRSGISNETNPEHPWSLHNNHSTRPKEQSTTLGFQSYQESSRACTTSPGRGGRMSPSLSMPRYKMSARPRGYCIIISNEFFVQTNYDIELKQRKGADFDIANLTRSFSKLHFDVQVYKEQTSVQILSTMNRYAYNADHSAYDCITVVLLSHGSNGVIYGTDSKAVSIDCITQKFRTRECPSLAGKPKLFFIGACQGSTRQAGTYVEDTPFSPADHLYQTVDVDANLDEVDMRAVQLHTIGLDVDDIFERIVVPVQETNHSVKSNVDRFGIISWPIRQQVNIAEAETDSPDEDPTQIPDEADFLIGYASKPGYVSYRSRIQGTWYITKLTELLDRYAHVYDLLSILVKVNQEVAEAVAIIGDEQYKQIPAPVVTLRKKLYFH